MNQRPGSDPEDLAAFHAAVDGAIPLRNNQRIVFEPPKPRPQARQRELDDIAVVAESLYAPLDVDDWLDLGDADSFVRPGVQRTVLRDLRRGRWAIQSHIDLHGMNRNEAHEAVTLFIATAHGAGKRCLRIVHGRGLGSPDRQGVLRRLVKGWLARRRDILAFCHAAPRDGGDGALWVLLRAGNTR